MSAYKFNPESTMLQQVDARWAEIAMLILWKLAQQQKVTITADEIARCKAAFGPSGPIVLIHGHTDSVDFQIVTEEQATRLAAHDATLWGQA